MAETAPGSPDRSRASTIVVSSSCLNKKIGDSCIMKCDAKYDSRKTSQVHWYSAYNLTTPNLRLEISNTVVPDEEDGDEGVIEEVEAIGTFPGGNVTVQKKNGRVYSTLGFNKLYANSSGMYACVFQTSGEKKFDLVFMILPSTVAPPVAITTVVTFPTGGSESYDDDDDYVDGRVEDNSWIVHISGGALAMVVVVFCLVGGILVAMKRCGKTPPPEGLVGKTSVLHVPLRAGDEETRPPKGASRMANSLSMRL